MMCSSEIGVHYGVAIICGLIEILPWPVIDYNKNGLACCLCGCLF